MLTPIDGRIFAGGGCLHKAVIDPYGLIADGVITHSLGVTQDLKTLSSF